MCDEKTRQEILRVFSEGKSVAEKMPTTEKIPVIPETASPLEKQNLISKKKRKKEKLKQKKDMTLRDLFPNETTEVGTFLYFKTSISENKKNAIQTLDNFLILIEKPATDDLAYHKLIEIINTYYHITKSNKQIKNRRRTNGK